MMTDARDYAPYVPLAAEGSRIGLMGCLRCGATVMIEHGQDWTKVHDDWHNLERPQTLELVRDGAHRHYMPARKDSQYTGQQEPAS